MAEHKRPRDVSTIVSILPFMLHEQKPGLIPGSFTIPKVEKGEDFVLVCIERCSHAVYLDEARPRLVVPDPSDQVAQSIVYDFKTSVHGYVADIKEPGIDWVYGDFPGPEGKKLFAATNAALLKEMKGKQEEWFKALVNLADDDWTKYHRHNYITPIQRHAAMVLGLEREWLVEQEVKESQSRCKFCFQMIHPQATICAGCLGDQTKDKYTNVTQSVGVQVPITK